MLFGSHLLINKQNGGLMKKMLITALVSVFFAPFATAEVNVGAVVSLDAAVIA